MIQKNDASMYTKHEEYTLSSRNTELDMHASGDLETPTWQSELQTLVERQTESISQHSSALLESLTIDKSHLSQQNYACNDCGKQFSKKWNPGIKPYRTSNTFTIR